MNVQGLLNVFTCFFESLIMFKLFDAFLGKRRWMSDIYRFGGIIILTVMIMISNKLFGFGIMNTVGIVVAIFIASFLYKGKVAVRAMVSALGILLATVSEIIVVFALAYLFRMSTAEIVGNPSTYIFGTILSKIVTYAVFTLVCFRGKDISKKRTEYWVMFFIVFLTAVLSEVLFFNLSYNNANEGLYDITVICSIGVLVSAILTLYLYDRMLEQNEAIAEKKIYEQQLKEQKKHLEEILVAQEEVRKFRHDFFNHIIAIRQFFLNKDETSGIEYVDKIKEVVENSETFFNTGNIALDAILNSKKALAISKNIKFDANLQIPENLWIDAVDICTIFGNALDNAVEACDRVNDREKLIKVDFVYDKDSLICKITNTCNADTKDSVTSKQDKTNHGYGIGNIKTALEKYKNIFKISAENNEFVLSFVIFK